MRELPLFRSFQLSFMLISTFIFCISCSEMHSASKPISLEEFRVNLPGINNLCDTVLIRDYSRANQILGVVKFDRIPLWRDITKRDVVDSLSFADTVTIQSIYAVRGGNGEEYYKLKDFESGSLFYTPLKNIQALGRKFDNLPTIYFQSASQNINADTSFAKKIINLIEYNHLKDTIRTEDEGGQYTYTGYSAALYLKWWLYNIQGRFSKAFQFGQKLLEVSPENSKHMVISQLLGTINTGLSKSGIKRVDVQNSYVFLKNVIKRFCNTSVQGFEFKTWIDLDAAVIIAKHWKLFSEEHPSSELLNILLSSKNEAIQILAAQIQSILFINENNTQEALNTLLKCWQKYPYVTKTFFKDDVLFSLIPTAITIDSLLNQSHDYSRARSFIQLFQNRLTEKDSILNYFLEERKFQLCVESNCSGINYDLRKFSLQQNLSYLMGSYESSQYYLKEATYQYKFNTRNNIEVIVKQGAILKDGVKGKKIRLLDKTVKARMLYFYPNVDFENLAKVEIDSVPFWVEAKNIENPDRVLFPESLPKKSEFVQNPIVKEILRVPNANQYRIQDINSDNIPDLIGMETLEYAIDGKTMKTLWSSNKNQNPVKYNTFFENDRYAEEDRSISKKSIQDNEIWRLNQKIPQYYGFPIYPILRHHGKVFVFTSAGYFIEINDLDGKWIGSYKFNHWVSNGLLQVGKDVFFIVNYTNPNNVIHSILQRLDLESREVTSIYQFEYDYRNSNFIHLKVLNNVIYLNRNGKIIAIDTKTSARLKEYDSNPLYFYIEENHLIVCNGSSLNVFDIDKPDLCWELKTQEMFSRSIVRNNTLYVCTRNELFLLSLKTGEVKKKFPLPTEVNYLGAMKYYDGKILVSGVGGLIVIENED
jgi:hypothetical protein